MEDDNKKKKRNLILIIIIFIIIIAIITYFITTNNNSDETTDNTNTIINTNESITNDTNTNTTITENTNSDTTDVNIIPLTKFEEVSNDWYEHIWFNPNNANREVTYSNDGVTFAGLENNSRAGIMTDVETDVSKYSELNLHLITTNSQQTLTGTGWDGREAPVAVAVSYTDTNGLLHVGLNIDPTVPEQIFWQGFYTSDPEGGSGIINGTKVVSGEKFTYDFDLMTLDPKPVTIHYVGLEGAGWPKRQGTIHELSLVGIK
ncbi:MAG: hypothetical protein ACNFW9_05690 [Candidatus Kerfeldbacteria bacterium]